MFIAGSGIDSYFNFSKNTEWNKLLSHLLLIFKVWPICFLSDVFRWQTHMVVAHLKAEGDLGKLGKLGK